MCALVAAFTSSSAFWARRTGQFMFDCPVQSHTSPKSTFVNVSLRPPPSTSIVCGPPAGNGPTFAIQRPSAPATACATGLPSIATEIFSPGLAQPQIGAAMSRCNTASLVKSGCSKGSGRGCTGHHGCGPAGWAKTRGAAESTASNAASKARRFMIGRCLATDGRRMEHRHRVRTTSRRSIRVQSVFHLWLRSLPAHPITSASFTRRLFSDSDFAAAWTMAVTSRIS